MSEEPKESLESLVGKTHDPLIQGLNRLVVICVKVLAVLMVAVIWMSLVDVVVHLLRQAMASPMHFFSVEALISTFGSFLAVLIAIEIFLNIIFYLKEDAIHVPLVLATALTAVARKVIILDYTADVHNIYATATVVLSVGITYWLVAKKLN